MDHLIVKISLVGCKFTALRAFEPLPVGGGVARSWWVHGNSGWRLNFSVGIQGTRASAVFFSHAVQRDVPHDLTHPGREAGTVLKLGKLFETDDRRFLDDIFGKRPIPHDTDGRKPKHSERLAIIRGKPVPRATALGLRAIVTLARARLVHNPVF